MLKDKDNNFTKKANKALIELDLTCREFLGKLDKFEKSIKRNNKKGVK